MHSWPSVPRALLYGALGLTSLASLMSSSVPYARAARVTITWSIWDTPDITSPIVAPCAQQYPDIDIKVLRIPSAAYATKLQTEFAAGTAPDVFHSPEGFTEDWARQGQILDQTSYRKALNLPVKNVVPGAVWTYGQKLLGVSYGIVGPVLLYNKDVFQQAHIAAPPSDAAHAWTWDQFVAVAKRLTIDRHGRHPGDAGFDPAHIKRFGVNATIDWWLLSPLINSNGGSLFDTTYSHFTMNEPAASDVVQKLVDLADKYHVMPTPQQVTSGAGSISLASGRLAMQLDGHWQLNFLQHPTITFPLGLGVLPKFKQYRTTLFGPPEGVWAKTPHPKEAVEVAACLGEQSFSGAQSGVWLPTSTALMRGSGYTSWADNQYHPSTYRSVVIDTLKYVQSPPVYHMSRFNEVWTDYALPALDRIIAGAPAQSVLTSIKPKVDSVLTQH